MADLRRRKNAGQPESKTDQRRGEKEKADTRPTWLIVVAVLLGVVLLPIFVLIVIPSPIDAQEMRPMELRVFEGPLAPNDILKKAVNIYENNVFGPTSLLVHGDDLYTLSSDGKVFLLRNGEAILLAKPGKGPCGGVENEETCGRPLGIRMDKSGFLYITDAYLGLYRVDTANRKVKVLWPASAPIDGQRGVLLNDLDISSDGKIYFTDSSTKWSLLDFPMSLLEGEKTGRLIEYDPEKNTTRVLMADLYYANGVQLSKSEDYLLVVECTIGRILKYYLKGPRHGEYEVFVDNLPGLPDNIRPSSTGGYWISLAKVKHRGKFNLLHYSADKPWLRNILAKFGSRLVSSFVPKYGLIIELDERGAILRSFHDPTGSVIPTVSEVADTGSVLYLGSFTQPHLSKLVL